MHSCYSFITSCLSNSTVILSGPTLLRSAVRCRVLLLLIGEVMAHSLDVHQWHFLLLRLCKRPRSILATGQLIHQAQLSFDHALCAGLKLPCDSLNRWKYTSFRILPFGSLIPNMCINRLFLSACLPSTFLHCCLVTSFCCSVNTTY